jgi:hypothetical protein
MTWRVAKSLLTLRQQVDAMAPGRDKSSDGTIGDQAHQARNSDHNPNSDGVVTAMDITNDPAHGVDSGALADMLRLSKDKRIKYVISNRRIFSSTVSPWQWRPYNGTNAHTKHVHVSVVGDEALYDDTDEWAIDRVAKVTQPPLSTSMPRSVNITATVFGGHSDPNPSAYDQHRITDEELGVALPARFPHEPRPKVRVTNVVNGRSVECDIVDIGPWNTQDPYWETGARPQAESGFDLTGRKTNLAGIDLTPGAARAVGLAGKGKVDWEFVGAHTDVPVIERPVIDRPVMDGRGIDDLIVAIRQLVDQMQKRGGIQMPAPATDLSGILQQVANVLQNLNVAPNAPIVAPAQQQEQSAQLQKILDFVSGLVNPGGKSQPLGQVNGALGETIGNLLNGKKTAIGTIGALLTAWLSNVPPLPAGATGSGVLGILQLIAGSVPGLSGFTMPLFLALTAWGALGKLEKWAQGTAPPPTIKK